ncbi:MAG TPA: helix-turn-helix domain-containing protein [Oleiagrimonas sp.]|nr:helix-turn-helix domain-containing protein [Oleiagrimonas sp.]
MDSNFQLNLERLKEELHVREDREVATWLGMSKSAFSERKRRGAFPSDRLFQQAAKCPDSSVDVNYVLSGKRITDVPGALKTKHAQDEASAVLNNIFIAAGVSKDDWIYQPLVGVLIASRTDASVDGAVASLVNTYANKRVPNTPMGSKT